MVCTANDLQGWKDFPKGLRVLLLEGDNNSASEIRAKLESMDYNGKNNWIPFSPFALPHFFVHLIFSCHFS
jgi:hypothetical protein